MDESDVLWGKVLWSNKTKIELSDINDEKNVWRSKGEAFKPKNTEQAVKQGDHHIFAARGTGTLHNIGGIMKKQDYLQTLQLHLRSAAK